jgi:hypothetical protein
MSRRGGPASVGAATAGGRRRPTVRAAAAGGGRRRPTVRAASGSRRGSTVRAATGGGRRRRGAGAGAAVGRERQRPAMRRRWNVPAAAAVGRRRGAGASVRWRHGRDAVAAAGPWERARVHPRHAVRLLHVVTCGGGCKGTTHARKGQCMINVVVATHSV